MGLGILMLGMLPLYYCRPLLVHIHFPNVIFSFPFVCCRFLEWFRLLHQDINTSTNLDKSPLTRHQPAQT